MDRRIRHRTRGGNFERSRAASKYYSYGSAATKTESAKDDVALKYYGKLVKIENKAVARLSIAKIFCALIVCLCAISMVFARSTVYNYQLDNENLAFQLDKEREETASIIAQQNEKVDIALVEEIASTRLNMAKPQSYQIVYIRVPKADYTVMHEAATVVEKEKPKFAYGSVVEGVKNLKYFGDSDETIDSDKKGEAE